ncbi:MAG: 23S rRNA (guanosine(2251)-2'-O)-methyltransferase RlmB [Melioribacter sp.]|nr:23S rRNA (guanosine(2251)-2'-O)-methyltransferase RlmB [Melioribacter sp.]
MIKIYGRKPVLEAINSNAEIEVIYIAYGQHGEVINKIFSAAKNKGIKISQLSKDKFDKLSGEKNSQGVIAIKRSYNFYEINELIEISKKSVYPLLLLLDSIQDTHNLGAIIRTAECAGVDGIVITTNNTAPINETVEKASAGALSHVKICKVNNLNQVIKLLKENGYWVVGSYISDNSKDYTELDYRFPLALILGNEEKGIRKLIASNCDYLVKIPLKGKINSLNVSVAAGVLLFGILEKRGK